MVLTNGVIERNPVRKQTLLHTQAKNNLLVFFVSLLRSFWAKERVAQQWDHRSEVSNRAIKRYVDNPDELLPIFNMSATGKGSRGAPKRYDWSFLFRCRRHRPPQILKIGRDSVGTRCPVYIRIRKHVLRDEVEVTYCWHHNHDDSAQTRAKLPLGKNELEWTKARIAEGQDWKGIRAQLRLDKLTLDMVLLCYTLPHSFNLVFQLLFYSATSFFVFCHLRTHNLTFPRLLVHFSPRCYVFGYILNTLLLTRITNVDRECRVYRPHTPLSRNAL